MGAGGLWRIWGWLKVAKEDALLLYHAWGHPHTPPYVKGLLVALLAYVISPVDIVPDYLPFIGVADDIALIPAALISLTKLLPVSVRTECQRESAKWRRRLPWFFVFLLTIFIVWMTVIFVGVGYLLAR